jgi:hypothetical protein
MPGFLGGSSGSSGTGGEIRFPKEFIDPVTKLRISQPENLIDTDFEYGLQPTKWETVELINNTPSFFSKSGDTTIPGIASIATNTGTREITVVTATDHGLAVGIPINVTGTKSVTANGSYIINSIPNTTTFTYLCKDIQQGNNAIEDLYTSIITGEFFQGSQIRIADAEGIITDGEATSTLTVKTDSTHGFGLNTPFYFLNLNSTISQEFEASNTAAKSFDSSNSATAQTFDGSNSLSTFNIDWSNSATVGGSTSTISSVNTVNNTITVNHGTETFASRTLGTALYYNLTVPASSGYFSTNPRGVVFLKTTNALNSPVGESTFQVSEVPDGDAIDIVSSMSGTFQLANQARTFAGNNDNSNTQVTLSLVSDAAKVFDGANDLGNIATVSSYSGSNVVLSPNSGVADLGWYPGTMVLYSTTGSAASGLSNGETYFIDSVFQQGVSVNYTMTLRTLPTGAPGTTLVSSISGGTGTQTFKKIGVSTTKEYFHIQNNGYAEFDMLKYNFPVGGRVTSDANAQNYYWVEKTPDAHNFTLSATKAIIRDGSASEKAANSVADLRSLGVTTNGAYYLDPGLVGNPYLTYIKFNFIDGGDWQLILKVHNRGDMPSGSAFWTNSTLQNAADMNLTSGNWSKYAAWNRVPFTRLMMEMTANRVPPIMIFSTARTMFEACTLRNYTGGFNTIPANSTDPQIGTSVSMNSMPMKSGSAFPLQTGTENILQQWGIGSFANNSANSTTDNAGLSSLGRAGAWVGCPMDEGAHSFGAATNGGADSGFGFGGAAGNAARTWSAGYGQWSSSDVVNTLPGYLWVR